MNFSVQPCGEDRYPATLAAIRRFWNGEGRYCFSLFPQLYNYARCFDFGRMLELAPQHLAAQAGLPGVSLPVVTADWGTVSTAKYWGGAVHFDSTGGNIFIDPAAETLGAALALRPHAVDNPTMDAAQAVRFYRTLANRLSTEALWLRGPDLQGPLNTAGLILRQEALFTAMYDEPRQVHAFLEKVTDFLVAFSTYLRQQTGHRVCGNVWPYTIFPEDLGLALTEDLMPLTSARLYREFAIPHLRHLQEAFGRLHIHCCGAYGHQVKDLRASGLKIAALEFHYPAMQLKDLEPLAEDVVFIPYLMLHQQDRYHTTAEFYRDLLEHSDRKFRFWFACASDEPELRSLVTEYGDFG